MNMDADKIGVRTERENFSYSLYAQKIKLDTYRALKKRENGRWK